MGRIKQSKGEQQKVDEERASMPLFVGVLPCFILICVRLLF